MLVSSFTINACSDLYKHCFALHSSKTEDDVDNAWIIKVNYYINGSQLNLTQRHRLREKILRRSIIAPASTS